MAAEWAEKLTNAAVSSNETSSGGVQPDMTTPQRPKRSPAPRSSEVAALVGTLAFSAFAVSVDLHNDEVQAAVLVILVGGFLMGALAPGHAWRWALLLGSSIFLGEVVGYHLGLVHMALDPGWNYGTLVAMIPAFIGTYVGVGVRAAVS